MDPKRIYNQPQQEVSVKYLRDQVKILKIRLLAEAARKKKLIEHQKEEARSLHFARTSSGNSDTQEAQKRQAHKAEQLEPLKNKIPDVAEIPKYINTLKQEEMGVE